MILYKKQTNLKEANKLLKDTITMLNFFEKRNNKSLDVISKIYILIKNSREEV